MKPKATNLKWFQESEKDLERTGITEKQTNIRNEFRQTAKNNQGFKARSESTRWREATTRRRKKALIYELKRYWQDIKHEKRARPRY